MAPLVRLAAPLAWAALALAAPGAKQPNIIWLLTDDMDLHGYQVMPNLQAELLGEGMEFTNSFVASPKCCPSRTSALSGRFPHGMDAASLGWCGNFATDWENRTFFVGLQQAGYTTAAIGKFFNQEPSFCGANIHVPHGLDDCFLMCEEVKYYNITYNDNGKMVSTGDAPTDYLTSVLGNRSLEFVRTATGAGQPFFMYLAVHAPHLPAIPAPWYANASVPTRAPRDPNWNTGTEGKHWQVATNGPMGDFYIAASDALFGDRLRTLLSVDDIVGDLVAELRAAGELDNTYIVFSSDHGYHNGQYRLWAEKSQIYDSDTRIPFLVRGPGVPAGSKNDALVSPIDVGATLLELAGAVAPGSRTTDGRSFVALLQSTVPAAAAAVEPAPAVAAAWPRDRVLIEFPGYPMQHLSPCGLGEAVPNVPCPQPAGVPTPVIDAPSNSYSALRIINDTHNVLYAEYRPGGSPIRPAATNWTEAYNYTADPYALVNLALPGSPGAWPPALLAQLSAELWAVATCTRESCP